MFQNEPSLQHTVAQLSSGELDWCSPLPAQPTPPFMRIVPQAKKITLVPSPKFYAYSLMCLLNIDSLLYQIAGPLRKKTYVPCPPLTIRKANTRGPAAMP